MLVQAAADRASALERRHALGAASGGKGCVGAGVGAGAGGQSTRTVSTASGAVTQICLLYTSPSPRDRG
eukprot:1019752-Rhodomonas_salina.2